MSKELDELADELEMHVSAIREYLPKLSVLPSPWRFDDWLNRYRTAYENAKADEGFKTI